MDTKTTQLVDDLIHNPDKYESLISEYFDTFDIEALDLTYNNLQDDINIVSDKLNILFNLITSYESYKNIGYQPEIFNVEIVDSIKTYIKTYNPILEIKNIIVPKNINKNLDKKIKIYIKYIEKNKILYDSYYNLIYIYHLINTVNGYTYWIKNILIKLIKPILKKYEEHAHKIIYDYQLYIEDSSNSNSKKLIKLCQQHNLTNIYDIYKIIKESNSNTSPFKSNLTFENVTFVNNAKDILIPEFHIKSVNDSLLSKPVPLLNHELYNILANSTLDICYNNKSYFTLYNEIKIKIRKPDFKTINVTHYQGSNFNSILTTYINTYITYFIKGYVFLYEGNKITFNRNAIIDIDFSKKEYEHLNNVINNCKHRYIFIYCSVLPSNYSIDKIIGGGHKTSLIIDRESRTISFFEPMDYGNYQIYYKNRYIKFDFINVILALELSKNITGLSDYKFLVVDKIYPQIAEFFPELETHIYHNIQSIMGDTDKKIRDWIGGYCGLWNLLIMYILAINPQLSLIDIYSFINKITLVNHSSQFCKLVIRNFAYHIENVIKNENYIIPVSKLNVANIDKFITSNELKFNNSNNLSFQRAPNITIEEAKQKLNELQTFEWSLKKYIKLTKTTLTILNTVTKNILFAKGGLALYAPDKVNFIKV